MSTDEAKAKGQEYSELAKKNVLPHHLGMTGYATKRKKWRQEEIEADAAGLENPFKEVDERGRDYFYARRPKKLKQGMAKYNEPKAKEAEKALISISAAKQQGKFKPVGQHDLLTEVLGNPEHHGRVRGISSRHSWKNEDSWQSDAASHHTRQRYNEGLIQKGRDEVMEEIAMGKIQEAFSSNNPKMVELRTKMFLQAGVLSQ